MNADSAAWLNIFNLVVELGDGEPAKSVELRLYAPRMTDVSTLTFGCDYQFFGLGPVRTLFGATPLQATVLALRIATADLATLCERCRVTDSVTGALLDGAFIRATLPPEDRPQPG